MCSCVTQINSVCFFRDVRLYCKYRLDATTVSDQEIHHLLTERLIILLIQMEKNGYDKNMNSIRLKWVDIFHSDKLVEPCFCNR